MTRVVKCQNEFNEITEDDMEVVKKRLCAKYEIPEDLEFFNEFDGVEKSLQFIRDHKTWIHRWVAGSLHEHTVAQLMEVLSDFHSVPVGWVFVEQYEPNDPFGLNKTIFKDLLRIGSRSNKTFSLDYFGDVPKESWFTYWPGACGVNYPET